MKLKSYEICIKNTNMVVGSAVPFEDKGEFFYIVNRYGMFEECFTKVSFEDYKKELEKRSMYFVEI